MTKITHLTKIHYLLMGKPFKDLLYTENEPCDLFFFFFRYSFWKMLGQHDTAGLTMLLNWRRQL